MFMQDMLEFIDSNKRGYKKKHPELDTVGLLPFVTLSTDEVKTHKDLWHKESSMLSNATDVKDETTDQTLKLATLFNKVWKHVPFEHPVIRMHEDNTEPPLHQTPSECIHFVDLETVTMIVVNPDICHVWQRPAPATLSRNSDGDKIMVVPLKTLLLGFPIVPDTILTNAPMTPNTLFQSEETFNLSAACLCINLSNVAPSMINALSLFATMNTRMAMEWYNLMLIKERTVIMANYYLADTIPATAQTEENACIARTLGDKLANTTFQAYNPFPVTPRVGNQQINRSTVEITKFNGLFRYDTEHSGRFFVLEKPSYGGKIVSPAPFAIEELSPLPVIKTRYALYIDEVHLPGREYILLPNFILIRINKDYTIEEDADSIAVPSPFKIIASTIQARGKLCKINLRVEQTPKFKTGDLRVSLFGEPTTTVLNPKKDACALLGNTITRYLLTDSIMPSFETDYSWFTGTELHILHFKALNISKCFIAIPYIKNYMTVGEVKEHYAITKENVSKIIPGMYVCLRGNHHDVLYKALANMFTINISFYAQLLTLSSYEE